MKLGNLSKFTWLAMAAAMAVGSLVAAPPAVEPCSSTIRSEEWNFPAEASRLLKEIQSTAGKLAVETATLESYPRSGVSRASHASQLTVAKEYVNAVGERLERLQAIRHAVAPWQQRAIDSIVPVAVNLAGHTGAAIEHLNQNPSHLWAPAYIEHLKTIANRADEMKEAVDLHLDYARTQERLDEIGNKLAVIGS